MFPKVSPSRIGRRAALYCGTDVKSIIATNKRLLEEVEALYIVQEACLICFVDSHLSLLEEFDYAAEVQGVEIKHVYFQLSCTRNRYHNKANQGIWLDTLRELARFTNIYYIKDQTPHIPCIFESEKWMSASDKVLLKELLKKVSQRTPNVQNAQSVQDEINKLHSPCEEELEEFYLPKGVVPLDLMPVKNLVETQISKNKAKLKEELANGSENKSGGNHVSKKGVEQSEKRQSASNSNLQQIASQIEERRVENQQEVSENNKHMKIVVYRKSKLQRASRWRSVRYGVYVRISN